MRPCGAQRRGAPSRRQFLRSVGAGALALGTTPWASPLPAGSEDRATPRFSGRVVEVFDDGVFAGRGVVQPVVERMLERGMLALTGAENVERAWQLFVTPEDVVGLKVNALSGPGCSTHREVVNAIIQGLERAGVKEENIIIWDRFETHLRRMRYRIQRRPGKLRCYATDSKGVGSDMDVYYHANVVEWLPESVLVENATDLAPSYPNSHFSKIFTQHITKQINVPVLKDHNIAGVSLCLKNLTFGVCNNTSRFHPSPLNCDPMIAEVYAHPMLQSKNVLNVADCLSLIYEGGPMVDPQYLVDRRSLILSTDAVAADAVGLEIVESIRKEKGFPTLWQTSSPPKYLKTAERLRLGVLNLEEVTRLEV